MVTANFPFPDDVQCWVALRTSARWEKQLAQALEHCSVPAYLPLMKRVTVYRSKRRTVDVPLFSGYVFCSDAHLRGNRAVPPAVRDRIAQVLAPPNPEKLRNELAGIAEFLSSRQLIQERIYGRPGEAVRVVGGMFAGEVGIIRNLKPAMGMVVLEISFLGVRLEVDFEEHLLQKLT